ncbi:MAG: hypothetical protein S4CHLAM7_08170 [Chlamydiae bacterium]|nr:hypothetical protein [Chlamydiota bacterium]
MKCMPGLNTKIKRFVALKGQPIHRGHCDLIKTMLRDASSTDLLMLGIVNPYPLEKMDLSKNRKPENFLVEKNPLTYFERAYLLRQFLVSIEDEFPNLALSNVMITPYFVPTIFALEQVHNYLNIKNNAIEYISDKDLFEKGKEKELHKIGVEVKFVSALKNSLGECYSAEKIRADICEDSLNKDDFEKVIFNCMTNLNLFEVIKSKVKQQQPISH